MKIHLHHGYSRLLALIYQRVVELRGWVLALMVVVYSIASWILFHLAGETGLVGNWVDFVYFAAVTASTVGYGDISPATPEGRLIAAFWFVPGALLIFTAVLSKLTSFLIEGVRRVAEGLGSYEAIAGATVIIGYHAERTTRMVNDMLAGDAKNDKIVLMARQKDARVPKKVQFVHSERLDSHEALARAATANAARVLVYADSDAETFNICLAVREINPEVHVAAYFNDRSTALRAEKFANVDTIVSTSTEMLVRAAQDPGSGAVLMALSSATDKSTIYSGTLSERDGARSRHLGDAICKNGATMVAISSNDGDGPKFAPFPELLPSGTVVYYIAPTRFNAADWLRISGEAS